MGVLTESTEDPTNGPLTICVARNWLTEHSETDALFAETVEKLADAGISLVECTMPEAPSTFFEDSLTVLLCEMMDDLSSYLSARLQRDVSLADVVAFNRDHADVELQFFGQEWFERAVASGGRASASYLPARERSLHWSRDVCLAPVLASCDALVAPSYGPAWKQDLVIGEHAKASIVTTPSAIAGWPIISVPMGFVAALPVGVAIAGRANDESLLLRVAAAVEDVVGAATSEHPRFRSPARG
jgi:amidase